MLVIKVPYHSLVNILTSPASAAPITGNPHPASLAPLPEVRFIQAYAYIL